MTNNDEPIYETVKRECNWDPARCEPLTFTAPSMGRHVGESGGRTSALW